jgi:hypothetical protein
VDLRVSDGEAELLIGGLTDDVAFVWVMTHLGLRGNPPGVAGPPTPDQIDEALGVLERLSGAGLVKVGRTEHLDGGPPGRVAPVRHVEEPLDVVAERVRARCAEDLDGDWEWSCWVVNTDAGDAVAHRVLAGKPVR